MARNALVVEDSIVFQRILAKVLGELPGVGEVTVVGTGREGLEAIASGRYGVVFLDLNLPGISGLEVLRRIKGLPQAPPVIVVSGSGGDGTGVTVAALQAGALEFVTKPTGSSLEDSVRKLRGELARAMKRVESSRDPRAAGGSGGPIRPATTVRRPHSPPRGFWITALAVSTGGPESLNRVIPRLPASYPVPIVVVQHMPPLFTAPLAESLDQKSAVTVVEASDGQPLVAGTVYIAPGGRHLTVAREGGRRVARLNDDPPECYVRPAADVLFRSLAAVGDRRPVLTVVMTGMGEDGRAGVERLKQGHCYCLAQSEPSCVVYGMPRAVVENGLADETADLAELATRMTELTALSAARV